MTDSHRRSSEVKEWDEPIAPDTVIRWGAGPMSILSRLSAGSTNLPDFGVFWVSIGKAARFLAEDLVSIEALKGGEENGGSAYNKEKCDVFFERIKAQLLASIDSGELKALALPRPLDAIGNRGQPNLKSAFVRFEDLHTWLAKNQYPHAKYPELDWSFYEYVGRECLLEREIEELIRRHRKVERLLVGQGLTEADSDSDTALTTALARIEELEAELKNARCAVAGSEPLHGKEKNSLYSLIVAMYSLLKSRPSCPARSFVPVVQLV